MVAKMRISCVWTFVVLAMLYLPATAFGQASITGTVRDASGAVLPGVTVEASSPALIEKVRSNVTDGDSTALSICGRARMPSRSRCLASRASSVPGLS